MKKAKPKTKAEKLIELSERVRELEIALYYAGFKWRDGSPVCLAVYSGHQVDISDCVTDYLKAAVTIGNVIAITCCRDFANIRDNPEIG